MKHFHVSFYLNTKTSSVIPGTIIMSGFYNRNSRAIWLTVAATSGLYLLYRYYIQKRREREEAIAAGLEISRRGVEKLVELRDKLVCVLSF